VVLQAIGGSTNGLIHLTAIANRTKHRVDLEAFDQLGREVPVLIDLKPSGAHYMEHFHHAGGVPKLMKELGDLIDLDQKSITGQTLRDIVANAEEVPGQDAIVRATTRLIGKARWRCCMAICRAARSSSSRRHLPNYCNTLAGPSCSSRSRI
jgi:dihydroxyacid dehydratase/phosphogluconate dehydratase